MLYCSLHNPIRDYYEEKITNSLEYKPVTMFNQSLILPSALTVHLLSS